MRRAAHVRRDARPSEKRRSRGSAMVEAAIVLPVLLLVLLGTLEFGLVLARYQIIVAAAREGARVGSLYRPECRATRVRQDVMRAVSEAGSHLGMLILPTDVRLTGACIENVNVEVEIEYDHYLTTAGGFIDRVRLPLRARAVMRNETS